MSEISDRFERVADAFTATVQAVAPDRWDAPAPCEGWTARDVVGHLVGWVPGPDFLLEAFGIRLGPVPPVGSDPVGAWLVVRAGVRRGLHDPELVGRPVECGPLGRRTFEEAVDITVIPDVLVHTWDVARATGLDEQLDPEEVHHQLRGVEGVPPEVDHAMRASGHFGPRVPVGPDADEQVRLLAFYGRRA